MSIKKESGKGVVKDEKIVKILKKLRHKNINVIESSRREGVPFANKHILIGISLGLERAIEVIEKIEE